MAYVYVLRSGKEDLFKVGRTRSDVNLRIRQLATGNPRPLGVVDLIETEHDCLCETYLHRRLRPKRIVDGSAREYFAATSSEIEAAIRDAREFLSEFAQRQEEVERLGKEESDGRLLTPSSEEWSMYRELLDVRADQDSCEVQRRLLENKLKLAIGRADGLAGIASWRTEDREKFDVGGFKVMHPEMFGSFVSIARTRVFRLV
jgi:Meiotically up-regulated gene 113